MESLDAAVKKIAKGAGISFVGKVASTGFKYLTQVILAWLLGAELFGLYTLGI
ncbi:MAG: polysaccharide biosynthesis protein, partial [Cyanobacteria bacterium QH_2_48_84]